MCKIVLVLVFLKVRLEKVVAGGLVGGGIGCEGGSDWKRDLRWIDWRGGRGGPPRLVVGLGGVDSGEMACSGLLGILRLLEIHFWISDAGDNCSAFKLESELFRL